VLYFVLTYEPAQLPDGHFDNAPVRAGGVVLILGTLAFVPVAIYYTLSAYILARIGFPSRRAFFLTAVTPAIALTTLMTLGGILRRGLSIEDILVGAFVGTVMATFTLFGATVWWTIAVGAKRATSAP
jgi:hypothetical protein